PCFHPRPPSALPSRESFAGRVAAVGHNPHMSSRAPSLSGAPAAVRYHFSGIAGAGVSPLARLMRARGHAVQGSDRALDQGLAAETAELLRREGIAVLPHDG